MTTLIGPIRFYAHEDWDGGEWEIEQCLHAGLSRRQAEEFVRSRPLYEVAFDFYVDPDAGVAHCARVVLSQDEVLERAVPGQQLTLWKT